MDFGTSWGSGCPLFYNWEGSSDTLFQFTQDFDLNPNWCEWGGIRIRFLDKKIYSDRKKEYLSKYGFEPNENI